MNIRTIHLHPEALAKPAVGAPCNGCGWCCASEPCPLGVLVSGRRSGACSALRWDAASARYHCGVLTRAAGLGAVPRRLVARWIGAGAGCDAQLERADPGTD